MSARRPLSGIVSVISIGDRCGRSPRRYPCATDTSASARLNARLAASARCCSTVGSHRGVGSGTSRDSAETSCRRFRRSRHHPGDPVPQVGASGALHHRVAITDAIRWTMCDEDVDATRNLRPHRGERRAALQVERPVVERRLPRRSVEPQALDRDLGVLEVVRAGKHCARRTGLAHERPVVVAGDDHFVAMRQAGDPLSGDRSSARSPYRHMSPAWMKHRHAAPRAGRETGECQRPLRSACCDPTAPLQTAVTVLVPAAARAHEGASAISVAASVPRRTHNRPDS